MVGTVSNRGYLSLSSRFASPAGFLAGPSSSLSVVVLADPRFSTWLRSSAARKRCPVVLATYARGALITKGSRKGESIESAAKSTGERSTGFVAISTVRISVNWRGRPLRTYETVINLIGNTSNRAGLVVRARLDLSVRNRCARA